MSVHSSAPHTFDPGYYTIPQNWQNFTAAEHARWDSLFARQKAQLADRAAPAFLDGIEILNLSKGGVPEFKELSERLSRKTGWEVVAVPGLVPDEVFFRYLASRCFPAGNFIRAESQMDYLEEPDVFHDVFGHVPLLANTVLADYMQAYGEAGLRSLKFASLEKLARLYWYTVEFGLIQTKKGLKIFGAGIVSSRGESEFSLNSQSPNRIGFSLKRVLRTKYQIDDYQKTYFVIDSFEALLAETLETDFAPLYQELKTASDFCADELIPSDRVITHGSQLRGRSLER